MLNTSKSQLFDAFKYLFIFPLIINLKNKINKFTFLGETDQQQPESVK